MGSIYKKITFILFLFFIIQTFIVGIFYRNFISIKILSDIKTQQDKRQYLSKKITKDLKSVKRDKQGMNKKINYYKQKYDIDFIVKTKNNEILFFTKEYENINDYKIKEEVVVKDVLKSDYIVTIYYPTDIGEIGNATGKKYSGFLIIAVLFISLIISLIVIYKILTAPLKKLSRAVNNINYGNTEVSIPYYGDDELGLLCRNFEDMGSRLKQSEDNQKELVQAISHDIKTPLTSIVGYSKRLLEGKVREEKVEEYYHIIYRKALDLEYLIEELEDYSNINYENKLIKSKLNVEQFFNYMNFDIKKDLENNNVSLITYCNVDSEEQFYIDDKKMKRVFQNIVDNSIKYAGNKITVYMSCFRKDKDIYFEIKDNGIGMEKEKIQNIFNRFYRADASRSRDKGGTGLGLAICKEIVEMHDGKIGAKSEIGHGLTIWFTIPITFEEEL